ncbi:MAG: ATP-binding protein [Thaumarchaeota archaeon]|nr:ATP-binding protein [Nitrososphaerota archaeon]
MLLLILLGAAVFLSLASYEYSTQVSANVANLSLEEIHSNSQIEASDLGHLLERSLEAISHNLDVLANSPPVQALNATTSVSQFAAAQNSTGYLTSGYYFFDNVGRLILTANGTNQVFPPATAQNYSYRPVFAGAKGSDATFFSSATVSMRNSSITFISISRSVYAPQIGRGSMRTFMGVVSAAVYMTTLGRVIQNNLSPNFKSSIGILDFTGNIIYSSNESFIGANVFGSTFQNSIPSDLKPEFNAFLNESLRGQAGYQDLSYRGASTTLTYQPLFVNATTSTGNQISKQFGVLYVTASDTLATAADALIGQQQFVGMITIFGIVGVSVGLAVTTLLWNRRLNEAVKEKTADLVNANAQLAAKAQAEKDLLNITAHELRTPTQSILVNSEILRNVIRPALGLEHSNSDGQTSEQPMLVGNVDPNEVVEMVESSYRNSQRLQKLTQNILEVARIDNNMLRLERETFNLNDVIRQAVSDARRSLYGEEGARPQVVLSFEPKQSELLVNADRTKLSEVVNNLLENSIKFTKDGGKIKVMADKDDRGFAIITITDEGSGIDTEIFPRLFTKFGTKTGTGLGLYISKAYIEAHGGTITAENNTGTNWGATFRFSIPLVAKPVDEAVVNIVKSVEERKSG